LVLVVKDITDIVLTGTEKIEPSENKKKIYKIKEYLSKMITGFESVIVQ